MKFLQNAFLSTALLVYCFTGSAMTLQALSDIQGHVYQDEIQNIYAGDIVNGYPDGTYRPDQTINRAEFTKIIVGSVYTDEEIRSFLARASIMRFEDLESEAWYGDYVYMAAAKGIIAGYEDGTFRPSWEINFAEGSKILVKAFNLPEGESGDNWYDPYLNALRNLDALPPSFFQPAQKITRGEMAYMISHVLGLHGRFEVESDPPPSGDYFVGTQHLKLGDGKPKILFFHATWCPKCLANAEKLQRWYDENDYEISTYQLDYDTQAQLKQQFGVTAQDTFLWLDKHGTVREQMRFPTSEQLQAWLQ